MITNRPSSRLLEPAAALVVVVVGVQLPTTIYAGSASEFDFGLLQLLPCWLGLAAAGFLVLVAAGRRLSAVARGRFGALLWAVGVWAWIFGNVVVFPFGELTGVPIDFAIWQKWLLPELALAAVVVGLSIVFALKRPSGARLTARFAVAVLLVVAGASLAQDLPKRGGFRPAWPDSLARFAPRANVLVVLLDTFQADVLAELVAADPELGRRFDGFTFYPNTLGVARTTALTMPAVHTGLRYEPGWTLEEYYQRAKKRRSFLSQVAKTEHEVTVVQAFGFCPRGGEWCGPLDRLAHRPWRDFLSEVALPVDLAMFRVAPLWVKAQVYNRGRWLALRLLRMHPGREQQARSLDFLEALKAGARVEEGPPTVKFFHLPAPHAPLVTGADCELLSEDLPKTRDHMVAQSRCTLERTAELLDRLRELGIYDSAMIVLMSDHGAGLARDDAEPAAAAFLERVGAANPMLLAKFPGADGALAVSEQPTQIDDVGKTVCQAVEGCRYKWGRSLTNPGGPRRPRTFLDYNWQTDFWYEKGRIDVVSWQVRGSLDEERSWSRLELPAAP